MHRRGTGRFGVVLLIIIVAIVMIGGIVFLGQMIFGGGGQNAATQTNDNSLLTQPTDNTVVEMTVRGPVVARESHYDIDMTISRDKRTIVIYRGYNRDEEFKRMELDNDQGAFDDLLLALNDSGYTTSVESSTEKNDGLCSSGQLIGFILRDGDNVKSDLWTTSCGGVGNFAGNNSAVIRLLLDQIPGANDAIRQAKRM